MSRTKKRGKEESVVEARARWLRAVGFSIRHLRSSLQVSQEELGYRAGLHRTYVSDLERGRRNPTAMTLLILADTLGTTPSELLRLAEASLEDGRPAPAGVLTIHDKPKR